MHNIQNLGEQFWLQVPGYYNLHKWQNPLSYPPPVSAFFSHFMMWETYYNSSAFSILIALTDPIIFMNLWLTYE